MSVNNISNNNAAQLQLYTQQNTATAALKQQDAQAAAISKVNTADSVQISEQAKALLSAERPDTAVTTQTNGMGIEPPKTSHTTTLTNGMGIEPPQNS